MIVLILSTYFQYIFDFCYYCHIRVTISCNYPAIIFTLQTYVILLEKMENKPSDSDKKH